MWKLLFDFEGLLQQGADAVVYFVMAGIGTLLFLFRLGFAMFGGGEGGDGDVEFEADGGDANFQMFSVLSILAFFMAAGWMGLACRLDWGLGRFTSAASASGFGFLMMAGASGLAWGARRLNREVHYDLRTAIGHTARVYLTVPEKGEGLGQIEVSVSGRKKILKAVSQGPEIGAFKDVKVVGVRDDDVFVVEPLTE